MSHILAVIEGEPIIVHNDGSISYHAKFAVDTDGSGPLHGDPCAQRDTSLHFDGKPLNADVDKYSVVPPAILNGVNGVVLGCRMHCRNLENGLESSAVVGDVGPHKKLGEGSAALASALGINPSPVSGGRAEHIVFWQLWPGEAATVNGKTYTLQASR